MSKKTSEAKSTFSMGEKLMLLLVMIVLLSVMVGNLYWKQQLKMTVTHTEAAGYTISSGSLRAGLGAIQTRILTTTGTYYTKDVPMIITGRPFELQYRQSGDIALCDTISTQCTWLIRQE